MKIRILPSTVDGRHQVLTSYLLNGTLAVDAGALSIALSHREQLRIGSIVVTHTHLDHIASLPLLITDLYDDLRRPIELYATRRDFASIRAHLFNPRIWIDLETLHNSRTSLLRHHPIRAGRAFDAEGLRITPLAVRHNIPTLGLLIEDDSSAVFFTSDTGAADRVWEKVNRCEKLRAVFIDLSFPRRLTRLARASCHHSTSTLAKELPRIRADVRVYGVHLKAPHRTRIVQEVRALKDPRLRIARLGHTYSF